MHDLAVSFAGVHPGVRKVQITKFEVNEISQVEFHICYLIATRS